MFQKGFAVHAAAAAQPVIDRITKAVAEIARQFFLAHCSQLLRPAIPAEHLGEQLLNVFFKQIFKAVLTGNAESDLLKLPILHEIIEHRLNRLKELPFLYIRKRSFHGVQIDDIA